MNIDVLNSYVSIMDEARNGIVSTIMDYRNNYNYQSDVDMINTAIQTAIAVTKQQIENMKEVENEQ